MRSWTWVVLFCTATPLLPAAELPQIEPAVVATGPDNYYFMQSRGTLVPTATPRMLILTQEIEKAGSHGYRDVFQLDSSDGGRSWSTPRRIESLRRTRLADGDELVAGDLCPQWHAVSGTVLATGKTFTFRGGTREDRSAERVSYAVYDPRREAWSDLRLIDLPATDHAGRPILQPNSGCCQRSDLPDGDVLLPIRYATQPKSLQYTSIVARCRFDGRTLTYLRHGSELSIDRDRGLYEPSLIAFQGKYYLTLRADHSAFAAVSADGLNFEPPVEWRFDDGGVLGSYNTQQHWLAHERQAVPGVHPPRREQRPRLPPPCAVISGAGRSPAALRAARDRAGARAREPRRPGQLRRARRESHRDLGHHLGRADQHAAQGRAQPDPRGQGSLERQSRSVRIPRLLIVLANRWRDALAIRAARSYDAFHERPANRLGIGMARLLWPWSPTWR